MSEKTLKITALGLFLLAVAFLGASYRNFSNKSLKLFTEWDEPLYVMNAHYVVENIVEPMFPLTKEEIKKLEKYKSSTIIITSRATKRKKRSTQPTRKIPSKVSKTAQHGKSVSRKSTIAQQRAKAKPRKIAVNPLAKKLYDEAIEALNEGRVLDASAKLSYIVSKYPETKEAKLASQLLKGEIPTYKEAKARRLFIEAQHALGEGNRLKAAYLLNKAHEDYPETKYGKLALSLLKKLSPE